MDLRNGDCLELMKTIPDKSVDLFLCDLPYGETNCKWDTKIDMEEFWKEFKRIRKSPKVACIHFCSTKFGYTLIKSWEKGYKMDLVWKKRNKTGGLQSRHRPMRNHEMMYFFYDQAPKYNRDKYHKRIQQAKIDKTDGKNEHGFEKNIESGLSREHKTNFEPPNPASVVEEEIQKKQGRKMYKDTTLGNLYLKKEVGAVFEPPNPASVIEEEETDIYGETKEQMKARGKGHYHAFEPPNPASVVEEKTNYMGKTKQQVLDSRSENGIKHLHTFEPPNPASVVEEKEDTIYSKKGWKHGKGMCSKEFRDKLKEDGFKMGYTPSQPGSVIEEKDEVYGKACGGNFTGKNSYGGFQPPNPASVIEEKDEEYGKECKGIPFLKGMNGKEFRDKIKKDGFKFNYEPPNPASVIEEKNDGQKKAEEWGYNKCSSSFDNNQEINGGRRIGANYEPPNPVSVVEEKFYKEKGKNGHGWDTHKPEYGNGFEPPNPASVVEDETDIYGEKANDRHERYLECGCGYYDPPNPASVVESEKVFIGKRNHQTEKPQDVLEFLLKYWTDEDDVVLDPTMGSGSTGVACKTLKRKFIGFELDPKIYEVACNRINKIDLKTEAKKNKKKTKKI